MVNYNGKWSLNSSVLMVDEDDSDEASNLPVEGTPQGDFIDPYRNHLILAEQKAQQDYDKAVLTLSGGAIAVSFAFVKDMLAGTTLKASHMPGFLTASWLCWGLSVTCVLLSFFLSQRSLRSAIKQVDEKLIYMGKPGGAYSAATSVLNVLGGLLFIIGLICLGTFVTWNA